MNPDDRSVTRHSIRRAAFARMFEQLHGQTHIGDGKLAHPRCRICQVEFSADKLQRDGAQRRREGML